MRARTILCAVTVCAGLAMPAAADEGLTLQVGERITLKAEDMVIRQVLVELSEAVPFTLVERGEIPDQPVSFDFEAADWAEAIGVLLRGEGYSLTTDGATGQPRRLVVDWDVVGEALPGAAPSGGTAASGAGDDVESRIRAAAARLHKSRDQTAEAVDAVDAVGLGDGLDLQATRLDQLLGEALVLVHGRDDEPVHRVPLGEVAQEGAAAPERLVVRIDPGLDGSSVFRAPQDRAIVRERTGGPTAQAAPAASRRW